MATKKPKLPVINGTSALAMRKKLCMNQHAFWSRIGVTQSGGSRYETGRNIPAPVKKLLYITYINPVAMNETQLAAFGAIK